MTDARDGWGRRTGFLLAAVGSAIGLGNLWRFPTVTGESGGAAFLLAYLCCLALVGAPVLLAELALGRHARRNPVGAFSRLARGKLWKAGGWLAVATSLALLSYYSVIASWAFAYIFKTLAGTFRDLESSAQLTAAFRELTSSPWTATGLHALFMAATVFVVFGGVRRGIERWSSVLMPLLFLILVPLVIRSLTLPGAGKGLRFYLEPDFSKLTAGTLLNALTQVFFSLSVGMGIMITYGSYLSRKESLVSSTLWIGGLDTLIAFLAGLVIFPALFTIPGLEPSEGPELVFLVLPNIFDHIPAGHLFGAGFFTLLTLSALTSSISLLEVVVACFIDEWRWTRRSAVIVAGGAAFVLGVPSALSQGGNAFLSELPLFQRSFLEMFDTFFGKFCLAAGALLVCYVAGWSRGAGACAEEVGGPRRVVAAWRFTIRFICPALIAAIIGYLLLQELSRR